MAELKPCPFCGGGARHVLYHNAELTWIRYFVSCERCLAATDKYKEYEEAIEAWNRRAEDGNI